MKSDKRRRRRAVFLDRDGVINETLAGGQSVVPPSSLSELRLLAGVEDALQRLHSAGFCLIVVTNQPDVARGKIALTVVNAINEKLLHDLPLDSVEVCFHDEAAGCDCRKPQPGMLLRAAERNDIDLTQSFMVGDRWRDVGAGERAGVRTILVHNDHVESVDLTPWKRVASLAEAADWILETLALENAFGSSSVTSSR